MKKQIVEVDGTQVFSADWVFQQMQTQSTLIDRAKRIALAAAIIAALGLVVALIAILL